MLIKEINEGIIDWIFKNDNVANDPMYKGWKKVYLKNPDAAAMHERHKEFLAIFQNEDPDGKVYGAKN